MDSNEKKACDDACAKHIADHIFSNEKMATAAAAAFKAGWEARVGYKPRLDNRQVWECEACRARTTAPIESDARNNLIQYSKSNPARRGSDAFNPIGTCKHFVVVPVEHQA
jgi:hypothetical protein